MVTSKGKGYLLLLAVLLIVLIPLVIACKGAAGPQGLKGDTGDQGIQGPGGSAGVSTGSISGQITDSSGAGISGATVVTSPATTSATTDASGNYQISDVPSGVYTIKATKSAYQANSQGDVSVRAAQTSTADLALAAGAPFPLAMVRAVTPWDEEIYPDSQVWITLHGGYDYQDSANIITSGLNNAGVGSYIYLAGKDKDKDEKTIIAWSWELVDQPMQSTAVLENAATQYPRLLTDKPGKYTFAVTVTNDEGATSGSTIDVYAGTYVGAQVCAACHSGSVMPDKVTEWQQTGHATKFEDTFNSYISYWNSRQSDYCVKCHTTGYNETDNAAGFDDLAQQSGWDPAAGSFIQWMAENNITMDDVKALPVAKLMNIQCESCHGPGGVHTKAKSLDAGVCLQCHYPAADQYSWMFSKHATGEYVGSNYLHTAEGATCVECHTGEGYVEVKIEGNKAIFPDQATVEEPATLPVPGEMSAITCAACHDPHQATHPETGGAGGSMKSEQLRVWGEVELPAGVTVDAEVSATCVECHANKRDVAYKTAFVAGQKTRGVHGNSQADVFYGVGAVDYGRTYDSSPHTAAVEEGCVQCHMAPQPIIGTGADGNYGTRDDDKAWSVGGHSFAVEGEWNGTEYENVGSWTTQNDQEVSLGGACNVADCHKAAPLDSFNRPAADYDGDQSVEGVQDEVQGLLDALSAELPQDAQGNVLSSAINTQNTTEAERKALWNYWLVSNDGSRGVHNTKFAVELLQETFEQLTGGSIGEPPPVPPNIVHVSGLTDCTSCHDGATAPFPTDHAGRTNDVCASCHQQGTAPAAMPGAASLLPHQTSWTCSSCHATGIGGAPQWPGDHAGRTAMSGSLCAACHAAP